MRKRHEGEREREREERKNDRKNQSKKEINIKSGGEKKKHKKEIEENMKLLRENI